MFKFKRIALFSAAACLAVSSVAMAGGPYVGIGAGYQVLDHNVQVNLLNSTSFNFIPTGTSLAALNEAANVNLDQFGQGALGTVYLGYGYCLTPSWWAALEINFDFEGTKANNTSTASAGVSGFLTPFGTPVNFNNIGTVSVATQQSLKWNWGPTFRLGYFLTDSTKLYGIIGAEDGRFNTSYTLNAVGGAIFGNVVPAGVFANQLLGTFSNNKTVWGVRYGAGLEVNLTNELGIRGEVTQTRYSSWTINPASVATLTIVPGAFNLTNTVAAGIKEKPVTTEAVVSVVWTLPDFLGAPMVAG